MYERYQIQPSALHSLWFTAMALVNFWTPSPWLAGRPSSSLCTRRHRHHVVFLHFNVLEPHPLIVPYRNNETSRCFKDFIIFGYFNIF